MAKLQREQAVREKRARKQERKDEKKQAAADEAYLLANPPEPVDEEAGDEAGAAEEAVAAEEPVAAD
jgi:hypothetical protein